MNTELCRHCGCKTVELSKCLECRLIVSRVCHCCNNIECVQTHVH